MFRKYQIARLQSEEARLRHQGDYAGALKILDRILAIDADCSHALNNKAAILIMFGRFAEATPLLQRSVDLDPANGQAWNNLGFCHYALGDAAKAVPLFHAALSHGYMHEGVNYNLGLALYELGDTKGAIYEWETTLRINPGYEAAREKLAALKPVVPQNPAKEAIKQEYLSLFARYSKTAPNLQDLDGTNHELEQHLDAMVAASPETQFPNLFIGVFPICSFNAQVLKADSGFLLLVNQSLMLFALQVSALVASFVQAESRGKRVPPEIALPRAAGIFQSWLVALMTGVGKEKLEHTPSGTRLSFTNFLFASLMDFVVAHELSHILCGHFDEMEKYQLLKTPGEINYYTLSQQQEFDADLAAIRIVKALYAGQVTEESMYMGATLFFEIVDALAALGVGTTPHNYPTHPPAAARRSAVITNTYSQGFLARLPRVDNLVDCIHQFRS
jgi:tetratricopeptide (TPR) repeat protein